MKNLWIYGCLFASVLVLSACIENDIPYPYIKGEIAAFEVEGQTGEAEINKNNRTIVVSVGDEVDIEELRITKFVVMMRPLSIRRSSIASVRLSFLQRDSPLWPICLRERTLVSISLKPFPFCCALIRITSG